MENNQGKNAENDLFVTSDDEPSTEVRKAELSDVSKVMDDVLSGPESPDAVTDDFSEENPYYDHNPPRSSLVMTANASIDDYDFPPPLDSPVTSQEISMTTNHENEYGVSQTFNQPEVMAVENDEEVKVENHPAASGCEKLTQLQVNFNAQREKPASTEPENMVQWRKDRMKMLQEKDEAEKVRKEEWSETAKTQLEIWEKNHKDILEKRKVENRKANEDFFDLNSVEKQKIGFTGSLKLGTKESEDKEELTVWENVAKLCDLSPNNRKIRGDVSRMRLLMLQLKNKKFSSPRVQVKS